MANEAQRAMLALAAEQDGVIGVADALSAGFTRAQFRYACSALEWQELQSGTFGTFSTPPTFRQKLRAAVIAAGPGAVVGGATAAALMKWDGFRGEEIVLIVPRKRHPRVRGARVHCSRDLKATHTWQVAGFTITTPARTLVDLSLSCCDDDLVTLLNGIARKDGSSGLLTLRKKLKAFAPKRARRVLTVLNDRIWKPGGPESWLETRILSLLNQAGFHPTPQFELRDGSRIIKRFDAAFVREKVAVESDGFATHGGPLQFQKDKVQRLEAQALGWQVIEVTTETLTNPEHFLRSVQQALSRVPPEELKREQMPTTQGSLFDHPPAPEPIRISDDCFVGPDPFALFPAPR